MKTYKPNGHAEQRIKEGVIVLSDGTTHKAINITFNDVYVTFTDEAGGHYEELGDRSLSIHTEEPPKIQQLSLFDMKGIEYV